MANFIQIPSKSPGQGGLGPSCQIRAGQQTQPRWIRPDPQNFRAFLMPEIPILMISGTFLKSWTLRAERCSQQTLGEFCTVNYASLKPSTVDLKREKFQYAFKTLAQFPFFCLHETHCDTRVTIFNRCTVPFFNLLKLLTGIFCQTLQWTWHFYAFLNLETCWFSSVFFTLS